MTTRTRLIAMASGPACAAAVATTASVEGWDVLTRSDRDHRCLPFACRGSPKAGIMVFSRRSPRR
jgi:hypothetical protein